MSFSFAGAGVCLPLDCALSVEMGRMFASFSFAGAGVCLPLDCMPSVEMGGVCLCRFNLQVLGSAYPWIARRLLTDRSPELREALRALLYSADGRFRFSRQESLLQVMGDS